MPLKKSGLTQSNFKRSAERLVSRRATKALYQTKQTGKKESQFEMLKKLELGKSSHKKLISHCETIGIDFLSTPFDLESLDFLSEELMLSRIKLPSGEITNAPLLLMAARQTELKLLKSILP